MIFRKIKPLSLCALLPSLLTQRRISNSYKVDPRHSVPGGHLLTLTVQPSLAGLRRADRSSGAVAALPACAHISARRTVASLSCVCRVAALPACAHISASLSAQAGNAATLQTQEREATVRQAEIGVTETNSQCASETTVSAPLLRSARRSPGSESWTVSVRRWPRRPAQSVLDQLCNCCCFYAA